MHIIQLVASVPFSNHLEPLSFQLAYMFSFLIIIHILPSIKQLNVLKFKLFPILNSKYYAYAHTISLSSLIFIVLIYLYTYEVISDLSIH